METTVVNRLHLYSHLSSRSGLVGVTVLQHWHGYTVVNACHGALRPAAWNVNVLRLRCALPEDRADWFDLFVFVFVWASGCCGLRCGGASQASFIACLGTTPVSLVYE